MNKLPMHFVTAEDLSAYIENAGYWHQLPYYEAFREAFEEYLVSNRRKWERISAGAFRNLKARELLHDWLLTEEHAELRVQHIA